MGYLSIGNVQESCYLLPLGIHLEERGYQRLVGYLLQLEKTCDLEVGIVVLRSMSFVKTPPIVSIPSDNGVTSRKNNVFDITSDHTTLDRSTHSNYFVRVN